MFRGGTSAIVPAIANAIFAADAYINSPQVSVPGTTMPFSGLPNAGDRADLIAYLQTLK